MSNSDLIAVNGALYSYDRFDEDLKMHKVAEVDVDEDGILTATYIPAYFTDEEMKNDELHLTEEQWVGVAKHLIRSERELDEESVETAATDIIYRCFAGRWPTLDALKKCVVSYLIR